MKRSKMCSGPGFDSRQVHQKAYWTVNIVKRTLGVGVASMLPNGPEHGFDRARSSQVDSGVGDDPKSSKLNNRKRRVISDGRLSLLRVEARETELPKPAPAGFFFGYLTLI